MSHRRGMTITELLVVIGIIAVLLALSLPAIQRVREVAMRAQSMNNLRQIAVATHQYVAARSGRLPCLSPGNNQTLLISLLPYTEHDNTYAEWQANLHAPVCKPVHLFFVKLYISPADPSVASLPLGPWINTDTKQCKAK